MNLTDPTYSIFKKEFVSCFVFNAVERPNWEQELYDFYVVYLQESEGNPDLTVELWCRWNFHNYTLKEHGFILKSEAEKRKGKGDLKNLEALINEQHNRK